MEKKAFNLHADKLRDLAKGIHGPAKLVKRTDQLLDVAANVPKPALLKGDTISAVVEKNPAEIKHKLIEDMMERGTTSVADVPISVVRSLPGVKNVWTDEAHGKMLYSYQKPLMDVDKSIGEGIARKAPFLKGLFTDKDMEPLLNVKTTGGDTVHGYVPVETQRLSAPLEKLKRVATPLLAVLGAAKVSEYFKPKKEEPEQLASFEEEYRQELIDKIAATFMTTVAPSSLIGVERHVRTGLTGRLGIPIISNKIPGSTPSKLDASEHAAALRRQVEQMRKTESTMSNPSARMSNRAGVVERLDHAEMLGQIELPEKPKLKPSKKLPAPDVAISTRKIDPPVAETESKRPALSIVKKAELSTKDRLLELVKEAMGRFVHETVIPKLVEAPVIASHPGASKPPPDIETIKRITAKMEGIDNPEIQKFVAKKKTELANLPDARPKAIHTPVKKAPDRQLATSASESEYDLEVVAMEQEKMRQASAMLKAAAERIRALQHEITKQADDNKKLTLQLIAKERSGRAVKLAKDMVSKGMLKRAQMDEEVDRIMDMNDSSFGILQKAVQNTQLRKTASEGLDSLTGLVAEGSEPADRMTFRDALSSFK